MSATKTAQVILCLIWSTHHAAAEAIHSLAWKKRLRTAKDKKWPTHARNLWTFWITKTMTQLLLANPSWLANLTHMNITALIKQIEEKSAQGHWVPACGGTETPFRSRSGKVLLYCWQKSTGRHAYLDCGTDLILSDEEAAAALAL